MFDDLAEELFNKLYPEWESRYQNLPVKWLGYGTFWIIVTVVLLWLLGLVVAPPSALWDFRWAIPVIVGAVYIRRYVRGEI